MFRMNGRLKMYLVTYDVASDKLRKKIMEKLKGYGRHIQYSVFECDISASQFRQLCKELEGIIETKPETHIRIYYLDKNAKDNIVVMGDVNYIGEEPDDIIFI